MAVAWKNKSRVERLCRTRLGSAGVRNAGVARGVMSADTSDLHCETLLVLPVHLVEKAQPRLDAPHVLTTVSLDSSLERIT